MEMSSGPSVADLVIICISLEKPSAVVTMSQIDYRSLLDAAKQASALAYCPYSNYNVGAAVLTFDGNVYVGCNIENYGFSQTVHAEESAVANAIAHGALQRCGQNLRHTQFIKAIAVWAIKADAAFPCGNCRQFLSEFGCEFDVVVEDHNKQVKIVKFAELVPYQFSQETVLNSTRQATVQSV
jgi:cytidine deaminase